MELVDTHCHLQFEGLRERQDEVLAEAAKVGVRKIICTGTTLEDSKLAADISKQKEGVWASVGTHPHDADRFLADVNGAKKLKELAKLTRVVAVGETGLDYYRSTVAKDNQQAALRAQIEVGLELDLPFIFHVRDAQHQDKSGAGQAWDDFWQIFDAYKSAEQRQIKGVVHSFSTHSGHLEEILTRGLYVGLNGIMTFTKDHNQLEAARAVPMDRLLLETDAPFLTPAPFRGELCEPKHVLSIADFLSKLREENMENLAAATNFNAIKLFNLG